MLPIQTGGLPRLFLLGGLFSVLLSNPSIVAAAAGEPAPITLQSLLAEMVDRQAVARTALPAYTCRQFSSYDRASTSPDNTATWFANGDHSQYLRVEESQGRKEWVMMDAAGPGAVVRIWSADPKGILRIYIDGAALPTIEAPLADVLGGRWRIGAPLSAERSRGWNLYLPIPYARQCKITSDNGQFYYQINYRTYPAGTDVRSFTLRDLDAGKADVDRVQKALLAAAPLATNDEAVAILKPQFAQGRLTPGQSAPIAIETAGKPAALAQLSIRLKADDQAQARRSTVLAISFDGEQTVWAPVGAFYGADVGVKQYADWWRTVKSDNQMTCRWIMPFAKSCEISLRNLHGAPVEYDIAVDLVPWQWDDRSMHFHCAWHQQYPIHALGARGTMDFNYVTVTGRGVYMGDTLAVMNPVPQWWGEGDEKIYVDGEKFPSHFGTGTEDYYGYAWCYPVPFAAPFHGQPRVDGQAKENNWGHTTVTRVRSLDAIPFTTSLRFDMEVWHWKECDEAYAVSTYFYAAPGAVVSVKPAPEEAARAIPQPPPLPPPMKIAGAIECETLDGKAVVTSPGVSFSPQGGFGPNLWSDDQHLFVQCPKVGDFIELRLPAPPSANTKPCKITAYATRSWDYGIVRFSVNGQRAGEDVDLFNPKGHAVAATGPIPLGVFTPEKGQFLIRVEVVGGNPRSEGTKSYFGLDCIVLEPQG